MPNVMFNLLHQNVFVVDDFTICPNRNNEIAKIRWNMTISHSILSFGSTAHDLVCSSVMISQFEYKKIRAGYSHIGDIVMLVTYN